MILSPPELLVSSASLNSMGSLKKMTIDRQILLYHVLEIFHNTGKKKMFQIVLVMLIIEKSFLFRANLNMQSKCVYTIPADPPNLEFNLCYYFA